MVTLFSLLIEIKDKLEDIQYDAKVFDVLVYKFMGMEGRTFELGLEGEKLIISVNFSFFDELFDVDFLEESIPVEVYLNF